MGPTLLVELGCDDATAVERRQASVAGGRSLLFDNHHVAGVDGHQVLAELQDFTEHAVRRREGVLVGAALHGGQALGLLFLAVARRLLDLHDDAAVMLHDLQDQHVDDTDQRAVGAAHDSGLATNQLVGELLDGLHTVLAELGDVNLALLQEALQLLLVQADGRAHQRRDVRALGRRAQGDLLRGALGIGHPAVVVRVLLGVLVVERAAAVAACDSDPLHDRALAGRDQTLEDFLAVDRAHSGVRRRLLVLLEALLALEAELDLAIAHVQALRHDALRGLHAVLVRQLLGADELVDVRARTAIGVLLGGLDQEALVGGGAVGDSQQHDVHDADHVLVL
mmetsp:Transcript_170743/g.542538  ORF Transcript_170743/g.542538 Transcript_170743/m.542538 type:complete len:338 (-) Transcript_170743:1178-2191(-)